VIRAFLLAAFTARTWRELGYALTGVFIAVPAFLLAVLGLGAGALSLFTVGLPPLVAVLAVARFTVVYFRAAARALLGWDWPAPVPLGARGWHRVVATLRDGTAWRALGYGLLRLPLSAATAYLSLVALAVGLIGATYPAWWFVAPTGFGALDRVSWAGTWPVAGQGLAALLAFPWVLRLLVWVDHLLVQALLTPSADRARIAALEASRAALRADAAAVLRRVERDLHDGTQARLVALGVTLSRIAGRTGDPAVRALVADARGTVTEALAELRDIVRGIHPPALDDGLGTALATLAARSAVPVEVAVDLPGRPSDATASALYFTVAELLTNVARHAGASRARLTLRAEGRWLRLTVSDDGHGGARPVPADRPGPVSGARASGDSGPAGSGSGGSGSGGSRSGGHGAAGSGLAGLVRRAEALDGTLEIDSPAGGPTVVTVSLPREG
jgi:signal transduction histidine kinase